MNLTSFDAKIQTELEVLRKHLADFAKAKVHLEALRSDRHAEADDVGDAAVKYRGLEAQVNTQLNKIVQMHIDRARQVEQGTVQPPEE